MSGLRTSRAKSSMSWDYRLTIELRGRESSSKQLARLAAAMETSARFGPPFRLRVYQGHPYTDAVEEHDGGFAETARMEPEIIAGVASKYAGDAYSFEAWWEVERLFWEGEDTPPVRDSYRVILYCLGAECDWPALRPHIAWGRER